VRPLWKLDAMFAASFWAGREDTQSCQFQGTVTIPSGLLLYRADSSQVTLQEVSRGPRPKDDGHAAYDDSQEKTCLCHACGRLWRRRRCAVHRRHPLADAPGCSLYMRGRRVGALHKRRVVGARPASYATRPRNPSNSVTLTDTQGRMSGAYQRRLSWALDEAHCCG